MNSKLKCSVLVLAVLLTVALAFSALAAGSVRAATAYYVDCSAATNGSGTQASPWNNLAAVAGHVFAAGDQVLFKRGVTCTGATVNFQGSGSSGSPIAIASYGTGTLPVLDFTGQDAGLKFWNLQYWDIQDIEVKNSKTYGIYFSGNATVTANLQHIHITNVVVHDINGGTAGGGGFVYLGDFASQSVSDVLVDGVTGYNTTAWAGIQVSGQTTDMPGFVWGSGITVRNSTVSNTYGDGILVGESRNIVLENNLVYTTGLSTVGSSHTPNGLWTYMTDSAVLQFNEVYDAHSYNGTDGGAFDIDCFNSNNTIQYNYAHDNATYGVAILSDNPTYPTSNPIVRYNIFSNDNRYSGGGSTGEFFLNTWYAQGHNRGAISNMQVYNNTVYWNPVNTAWYVMNASSSGVIPSGTSFFKNNLFYAVAAGKFVNLYSATLDYNLYWNVGGTPPSGAWKYNGTNYNTLSAFQATGQEAHGRYANPLLNDPTYHGNGKPTTSFTLQGGSPAIDAGVNVGSMGSRDFFGNAIPQGGGYDIGANESGGAPVPTATNTPLPTNTPTAGPTPTPTNTPTVTNTPVGGSNLLINPGFETGSFSPWVANNYALIDTTNPHTGSYAVFLKPANSAATVKQTVSGLTVGASYTYRAWCFRINSLTAGRISVTGKGSTEITSLTYAQISVVFTASATSHEFQAIRDKGGTGNNFYCDDFELVHN